ncbi:DUF4333 domain-containing protein [Mycobacterium sp. DL440]|uniref:DUF4333 domain-containing protein n=1 Tax=Mycobacterium sp. DL440 TaxID=2675523 RepID=UPI001FBA39B4|nr:DUF4333 domain-containing protein [Mycobacterium sp. DL440]
MNGPEQPWWARPGGAPMPGGTPPRPAWTPPPARQPSPPQPPQHHARPAPPPQYQPRPAPQPPSRPQPNPRPKHADRRLLIGAAIAVVTVAVIGAGLWVWSRADTNSTRLDVHQAESGVAQILSDPINGYGANRVVAVACNNGQNPVVRTGATFTCAVEINDTLRRVIVEFTDDNGTYAVDGPR